MGVSIKVVENLVGRYERILCSDGGVRERLRVWGFDWAVELEIAGEVGERLVKLRAKGVEVI